MMHAISVIHEAPPLLSELLTWQVYVTVAVCWLGVWALLARLASYERDESTYDTVREQAALRVPRYARRALGAPIWPLFVLWMLVIYPAYLLLSFLIKEAKS